ncbi:MAG: SIS domain-containing protein [Betaproteobacteria bacterium]|nr:SIS domain-containing protein [Betaproteobacteria bacterium]
MLSIQNDIEASAAIARALASDAALLQRIEVVALACVEALRAGAKLLFAGNGGSAADAQHMAGEFVSRFNYDRPGLAAVALTVDSSILTAIANDYAYDYVFARQIEAIGRQGDLFFAYSTSGNSPNILRALEAARAKAITTVGLTGNRQGAMNPLCDHLLAMPSAHTPRIQEAHLMVGHAICAAVERQMFPRSAQVSTIKKINRCAQVRDGFIALAASVCSFAWHRALGSARCLSGLPFGQRGGAACDQTQLVAADAQGLWSCL